MAELYHALGFHMHQPPGNLELLWHEHNWEARQIALCYQRPLKYARQYPSGRFHVDFSGILLDQFLDPNIQNLYREVVDFREMLEGYRQVDNIELIATGYYHPIFPLIPEQDWGDQLQRSIDVMQELFGQRPVGFWPPEMAFAMDMVPALAEAGFKYVVVDHVHVNPDDPLNNEETASHPYLVKHAGAEIAVVPRHRDLSNAQESGLQPDWLAEQITHRAGEVTKPAVFTTWSDGENGGWFRQTDEGSGFWGYFYAPYMERIQAGNYPVRPTFLKDYLAEHPPTQTAMVRTGAWNIGTRGGFDFSQWAGSEKQKAVLERVWEADKTYRHLLHEAESGGGNGDLDRARSALSDAHSLILNSETSCYFFWGDSWIPKAEAQLDQADSRLQQAQQILQKG